MALIGGDRGALERELDVVRFQVDEIASAGFEAGDDARLRAEAERLRHQELVLEGLSGAAAALGEEGAAGPLDAAAVHLQRAARHDPPPRTVLGPGRRGHPGDLGVGSGPWRTLPMSRAAKTGAASTTWRPAWRCSGASNANTAVPSTRCSHSVPEPPSDAASWRRFSAGRTASEPPSRPAERAVADAGAALTAARVDAARRLASTARDHLLDLGFVSPVVEFTFEPAPPGPAGTDRAGSPVRFGRSVADRSPSPRRPRAGELSRLVLALRLASGVADAAVIAFDEIDAGVGGATARALGEKLASLAERSQVLCVTPPASGRGLRRSALRR